MKALAGAPKPMSSKWIREQLPKSLIPASPDDFEARLNEATQAGQVWRYGKSDKALYWHSAPKAWVQHSLLKTLASGMKTKSESVGAVNKLVTVKGLIPNSLVESAFKELVAEGRVHVHPPYLGGRTKLHSLRSVDPADYLSRAVKQLSQKLSISQSDLTAIAARLTWEEPVEQASSPAVSTAPTSENVVPAVHRPRSESFATPPRGLSSTEAGGFILQAMMDVNPSVEFGDLVSIRELRERLDNSLDKASFDQAILDLFSQQRVALHRDDYALTKSESEREVLVHDGHGKYFNVVSLWRRS